MASTTPVPEPSPRASLNVYVSGDLLRPCRTLRARQQVLFQSAQFPVGGYHAKMVTLQIVILNMMLHACWWHGRDEVLKKNGPSRYVQAISRTLIPLQWLRCVPLSHPGGYKPRAVAIHPKSYFDFR